MRNKSILFFGWYFYPKVGGAETILLSQARELVSRGYKVSVIASVLDNNDECDQEIFGIKIFRRSYIDSRLPQNPQVIQQDLSMIINKIKPGIFHFHNGSYPSGAPDKSIGVKTILEIFQIVKKLGVPIIEHAHNAQLNDSEVTRPLRNLPWDYLICVSNFVRQEWEKLGTNAKQLRVIHNGIDWQLFSTATPEISITKYMGLNTTVLFSPARLFSLTTGKLNKQKNLKLVFDALGILIKKKIENFVFISIFNEVYGSKISTTAKQLIDTIIKEKDLNGKVKFIHIISPDKMPGFYAGADIVCVPSLYETFGLMYLEAMAAGKVVIASNTGGPKEYIRNNENGFFVNPTDAQELANLLSNLIQNRDRLQKVGHQAKIDAKKYSIKKMVDELEKIYVELL